MTQVLNFTLTPTMVDELRSRFRGPIVAVGDADYEDVRRIWNAAIEKRPRSLRDAPE
jgi:hypothetical protein